MKRRKFLSLLGLGAGSGVIASKVYARDALSDIFPVKHSYQQARPEEYKTTVNIHGHSKFSDQDIEDLIEAINQNDTGSRININRIG